MSRIAQCPNRSMQRRWNWFALTGMTIVVGSALPAGADSPEPIVARMGEVMPLRDAIRGIAFSPFIPARRIKLFALVPPFHGDDTRANRGFAMEYDDYSGRRYALAEWPLHGRSLDRFAPYDGDAGGCPNVRSFARGTTPSGIVWSTPHGLVMTLVPDGASDARTLEIEWTRLIRRGACR